MKIIHLEDSREDAELVQVLLNEEWPGCDVQIVSSWTDFAGILHQSCDVILSDFSLGSFNGLDALKLACEQAPDTPFIFLSGTIGEDQAIEAVKAGARDYVLKDNMKRLITSIRRALRESQERKQRRVVEEAHNRLSAILENSPDFVGMARLNGRMCYLNRSGLRMIGFPEDHDPGRLSLFALYPPETAARMANVCVPAAVRDGTWTGECALLARDGRSIPVSQVIIAHKDSAGQVEYLSSVMRDITASKEAEHRIRELADFVNEAREAIVVTDFGGHVTFWNKGAERLTGWTANEVLGKVVAELFDTAASKIVDVHPLLMAAGAWSGEVRVNTKAGHPIVLDMHITLMRDDAGQPKAHLSISTDITAEKSMEEQFLRVQRLESIGMLAAGIAHDLNNVLAPILMGAPILREHMSAPGDLKLLTLLEKSAERGAGLVRQVLGFAHGVGGGPQVVQVKHLLRDIVGVISQTLPKNIQIEENVPGDLWPIKANHTQIYQVLLNLCVNARDAMPKGGCLRIRAENSTLDNLAAAAIEHAQPGPYLVLHIEDTGTGIPPEVLPHIWEPFFTTKGAEQGTGLGLSTVRGIVENHHGFITLETKSGRGTIFRVHLPADKAALAGATPESSQAGLPHGHGELILIVDDEASIRDVACATLVRHGYRTLAAGDGAEAVALFASRSNEIRLVITDLNMPNFDGNALTSAVHHLNPGMKILTVSGMNSGNRTSAPRPQSANAFLAKPFQAKALLATVHKLLHE